ncbi:hypothetical protein CEXT_379471 [Caerostris extrusa]|uniref:Uncharacterized protein n=1 Tax=Caerostris extrusa TaxID=172846 RepID=A0AAV4XGZ3_CAEEX|nr:hypothetical protein CEXT_379471 [Caerostris extrusa]
MSFWSQGNHFEDLQGIPNHVISGQFRRFAWISGTNAKLTPLAALCKPVSLVAGVRQANALDIHYSFPEFILVRTLRVEKERKVVSLAAGISTSKCPWQPLLFSQFILGHPLRVGKERKGKLKMRLSAKRQTPVFIQVFLAKSNPQLVPGWVFSPLFTNEKMIRDIYPADPRTGYCTFSKRKFFKGLTGLWNKKDADLFSSGFMGCRELFCRFFQPHFDCTMRGNSGVNIQMR